MLDIIKHKDFINKYNINLDFNEWLESKGRKVFEKIGFLKVHISKGSGKLLDMIGDKHAIVHSNFGTLSLVKSSKYLEGNDDLSKTFDYLEGNVHSSIEFPFNSSVSSFLRDFSSNLFKVCEISP